MTEYKSKLNPGMQVGDYLLKELISEGTATRTWYAEQISVKREVIVDSLRSAILNNDEVREAFLEDVRAKARVDHPLIGSVFEAVREDGVCFYARERLTGVTLENYLEQGKKLAPHEVVSILGQLAEANIYLEQHNVGSIPIGHHQIYLGDKLLTRLVNMAIGEQRDYSVSHQDMHVVGSVMKELLDMSQPGATRVNSLCDHMIDIEREIPITWDQVKDLSEQVAKQLRDAEVIAAPAANGGKRVRSAAGLGKNLTIATLVVAVVLVLLSAVSWLYFMPKKTFARELSDSVVVDVDNVEVGGVSVKLGAFEMDAHEVTIAEFAEFLEVVEEEGMSQFMAKGQPSDITSYHPVDWEVMYKAAKQGLMWNGRKMGVNQPVGSVTWWAAAAFANWKTDSDLGYTYTLPSEAEWKAVLVGEKIEALTAGEWQAVDANPSDVTSSGVHGLAGGVMEWSLALELSEDGETKLPVLLGGSYLKKEGALHREVVRRKHVTRPDLGFRLVKRAK